MLCWLIEVVDDTISALHKSVRGSDPDAALYYLARMLQSGEDPLYIAVSKPASSSFCLLPLVLRTSLASPDHHLIRRRRPRIHKPSPFSSLDLHCGLRDRNARSTDTSRSLHNCSSASTQIYPSLSRAEQRICGLVGARRSKFTHSHPSPQCADEVDEGDGVWQGV